MPGPVRKENTEMSGVSVVKPHAVLTPFPAQGHINPMLKLAKLLHIRGFHITFVHTEYNYRRLLKSRGSNALDGLPDFQFEKIPDGLPPMDADVTQDIPSLCDSTRRNCLGPFSDLIARLNRSASADLIPPVSCLVSDAVMSFTINAAEQLGVPVVSFCSASSYSFLGAVHSRALIDKGLIPLKDQTYFTNGYLDTMVDWISGMKDIRLKDIPSFIRTMDPNDLMLNFVIEETDRAHKASAIVINTFDELEGEAVEALSSIYPSLSIYTIGPLTSTLSHYPQNQLASIGSNLWKEQTECLEWLETKEVGSVIYVNFGSITVMSNEQLFEFAWGLANSKKPFLWIIRPDLINGGSIILSSKFVSETKDRGLIASWCPQEIVLNHPSIGGFLTHCGWNSITESICAGVPMLCWPFFGDQPTNCRYACTKWGIGIEIDTNVKREDVERLVIELMVGEKGKKMKEKVLEWKKLAKENTKPGGSSYANLDKVIMEVMLKRNELN